MNKKLDTKLCKKYPALYKYRKTNSTVSSMLQGFLCADGKFALIDILSGLITKHDKNTFVVQVREVQGGLLFECNKIDEYIFGVQVAGATLAFYVCDECGAQGVPDPHFKDVTIRCLEHITHKNDFIFEDISDVVHLDLMPARARMISILQKLINWHVEKTNKDSHSVFVNITENNEVFIQFTNNDDVVRGMIDVFSCYSNIIDESTGTVIDCRLKNNKFANLSQCLPVKRTAKKG